MESRKLQNDLIILNDWADKIHIDRCKVMHLGNMPSNQIFRMVSFKLGSGSPETADCQKLGGLQGTITVHMPCILYVLPRHLLLATVREAGN